MEQNGIRQQRINRVMEAMREKGIGSMIITPSSDMVYLLGQSMMADERFCAFILSVDRPPFVFANTVYGREVKAWGCSDIVYWKDGEDPYPAFYKAMTDRGMDVQRTGVEPTMPARFLLPLSGCMKESRFVLNSLVMDELRRYKDVAERESMRESCRRCNEALKSTAALGRQWIGKTEADFAAHLCKEMTDRGIKKAGALVCAGANAAIPHYLGKQAVINEGDCLLVDFGGTWEGYCSDMSRTFYFSKERGGDEERAEFEKVYDTVLGALEAGQKAARLGGVMQDVDRAARAYIGAEGYGPFFIHRTGHGIGIDTHEEPCATEGEMSEIKPGMAFSIEPGIYLPGRFGIRIEDQALMTEDGVEILHDFERKLIVF